SQDRTRLARLITIVEVVGAGIVEIHGLLDQAQAEGPRVELEVPLSLTGDGGDVVEPILLHVSILRSARSAVLTPSNSALTPIVHGWLLARMQYNACILGDCIAFGKGRSWWSCASNSSRRHEP